ncbi:MAG: helix-turn-helix domain-containing protein [Desulfobulbia bacterium]
MTRKEKIREELKKITIKQSEVSNDTGIHVVNISQFLKGKSLGEKSLERLEKFLNTKGIEI